MDDTRLPPLPLEGWEATELREQALRPQTAEWLAQPSGSLAILRYEDVRTSPDPRAALLEFLQSAFEAGASRAGWDLADTATQWCPVSPDRLARLSVATRDEPPPASSVLAD